MLLPLVALAGCVQTPEISLPALDNTTLRQADALVVTAEVSGRFSAPRDFVKGAGAGAAAGMGAYVEGIFGPGSSGEGALLGLLLAPIGLPVAAAVGSSKAATVEEAEAAIAVFERYGQDRALLASLDRRLADRLAAAQELEWTCVAARAPLAPDPCPDADSTAAVTLVPRVALMKKGKFDPEIHIMASVTATASGPGGETPVQAEWRYRDEAGTLFELAADDGALLRQRLEAMLDAFATAIAEDLFLDPRPVTVQFRHRGTGKPEAGAAVSDKGAARRVVPAEPAWMPLELFDNALIIGDDPHGVGRWRCRIASLDGEPTPEADRQPASSRPATVLAPPGEHRVEVICPVARVKDPHPRTITVETEPATTYCTDGRTVTQAPGYPGLSLPRGFCGR